MGITWSLRKIKRRHIGTFESLKNSDAPVSLMKKGQKSRLTAEKVHQNATEQKKHLANRTRNDYSIGYENLRRRPAHWLYGQIPKK